MTSELLQKLFMDEDDIDTDKDEASTMKQEVKELVVLNHGSFLPLKVSQLL